MIRDLKQKDIDKVMEIWLESTIKAHDFMPEKYWQDKQLPRYQNRGQIWPSAVRKSAVQHRS